MRRQLFIDAVNVLSLMTNVILGATIVILLIRQNEDRIARSNNNIKDRLMMIDNQQSIQKMDNRQIIDLIYLKSKSVEFSNELKYLERKVDSLKK